MLLSRFLRNCHASVAPIFAVAAIPIIGFVGVAVDYSRANSARTAMQAALDSTALMVSREAANLQPDELSKRATQYFTELYNHPEVYDVLVKADYKVIKPGSFKVVIESTGTLDTTFARAIAKDQIQIGSSSEVVWGMKRLEVALALDNTGSMSSNNKMNELKKAVKSLLDTLEKAAKKPDDVKVAIIPFDTMVKVDKKLNGEPWLDFNVNNVNPQSWKGCIQDRNQSHDVLDSEPVDAATKFPAAKCPNGNSLAELLPLTNDWQQLRLRTNQMSPNGNTNVTIGLVWAWHALTANSPLMQASVPQPDLDKVIILLTDGDNTQNRWTTNQVSIDKRTAAACVNIKAANIKIYTVRVINGNAALLKNCATKSDMYYDVKQAGDLNAVFTTIAQTLANLRVAK